MILDLTSDLSFKVNSDFQGQSYIKHAISALSLPIETQYVLPLNRKSWSGNPKVKQQKSLDYVESTCLGTGSYYLASAGVG